MIRLVIGRMLLWLILPAAEQKWGRDAATCRLADGPLLHFPRDPLIFPNVNITLGQYKLPDEDLDL